MKRLNPHNAVVWEVKAGIGGFHPPQNSLQPKAVTGVITYLRGYLQNPSKGGTFINNSSQKRSINFSKEMLETLEKLAVKNHTTTSELVRQYVDKGLTVEGHKENIDFIATIIRQELQAIYHIEDIEKIIEKNTDRLAKMLMKSGKLNGAAFFLLIKVLMSLSNDGSDDVFDQMLSDAVSLGVDYMQKKDFQINSFLQDSDNLRKLADGL